MMDRLPENIRTGLVPNKETGCWEWTRARANGGYGVAYVDKVRWRVHRLTYTLLVGPIPERLQIDHLCRVPACANPDHLEAVTNQENTRRGTAGDWQLAKTHCPQGHAYSPENTARHKTSRKCRACHKASNIRYQQRKRGELSV